MTRPVSHEYLKYGSVAQLVSPRCGQSSRVACYFCPKYKRRVLVSRQHRLSRHGSESKYHEMSNDFVVIRHLNNVNTY